MKYKIFAILHSALCDNSYLLHGSKCNMGNIYFWQYVFCNMGNIYFANMRKENNICQYCTRQRAIIILSLNA